MSAESSEHKKEIYGIIDSIVENTVKLLRRGVSEDVILLAMVSDNAEADIQNVKSSLAFAILKMAESRVQQLNKTGDILIEDVAIPKQVTIPMPPPIDSVTIPWPFCCNRAMFRLNSHRFICKSCRHIYDATKVR